MSAVLKAFALLVMLLAIGTAGVFVWISSRGISARDEATVLEAGIARTFRQLAIPSGDRDRTNPVQATPEVLAAGMAHYADHCAACHGTDGSGDTEMGRGLYPKAPDMRLEATQSLSDGELFYVIENGVRLTGMPAWGTGTPDGEAQSWHLVHFIRRLPTLTPEQIDEIAAMVPRSPAAVRQELEEQRFLEGGDPPSTTAPTHVH
jgi:mono/diheme cytochrome c family protein